MMFFFHIPYPDMAQGPRKRGKLESSTPAGRVAKFPDELHCEDGVLFCKWCAIQLNPEKLDTLKGHFVSARHLHNAQRSKPLINANPVTLAPYLAGDSHTEFNLDVVQLCASADIPFCRILFPKAFLTTALKKAAKAGLEKFQKHMNGHPGVDLWKEMRKFNPWSKARAFVFEAAEPGLLAEARQYAVAHINPPAMDGWHPPLVWEAGPKEVDNFWQQQSTRWPTLTKKVRELIWLPPATAGVERSFSSHRRVIQNGARSFNAETAKMWLIMNVNKDIEGRLPPV